MGFLWGTHMSKYMISIGLVVISFLIWNTTLCCLPTMHPRKIHFVQVAFTWCNCNDFVIIFSKNICWDRIALLNRSTQGCSPKANMTCNLGMWSTSFTQIWLTLALTIIFMMINLIPVTLKTLSLSKYTLREAITLYTSNATLREGMWLVASKSMIPLAHVLGICFIMHYKCVIFIMLYNLHIFALFVLIFVSKTRNVTRNRNMTLRLGVKMSCLLCFIEILW